MQRVEDDYFLSDAPSGNGETHCPMSVGELIQNNPELNPPVIEGLLRESELMNIISASKIGKSWLTLSLALSTITGRSWLDRFAVHQGPVLLIDNELHATTLASRIRRVAEAMDIDLIQHGPMLQAEVLRGRLNNLLEMGGYFRAIPPGRYKLIVLDALYRFIPPGFDENSNANMVQLYNILDGHAQRLRSAFVLIHHSTKGNQAEKSVTDVGAGAGSMSRATDTHLILRHHAEPEAVAVEAAVRSWQPLTPFCLRWDFPLWHLADDLDPADLKRAGRKAKTAEKDAPQQPEWTPQRFVEQFLTSEPQTKELIVGRAGIAGISGRAVGRLLTMAIAEGLAFQWGTGRRNSPLRFATTEPDLLSDGE